MDMKPCAPVTPSAVAASLGKGLSCQPSGGGVGLERDEKMLQELRRMNAWEAVVNNIAFMGAPLLLPSLFARTGWTIGMAFTIYSAVLTYLTGVILGDICRSRSDLHSYPRVAEEAFSLLGTDGTRRPAQGRAGKLLVQTLQFLCFYLTGIAELIYFEQYLAQLLSSWGLCQRTWLLVTGALCWPCIQIPTFKEQRWIACFTILMIVFNTLVFTYEVFLVHPWTCEPGPQYPEPTLANVVHGLTGIAYAFGGHGLFPEQIREMKDPGAWNSVMTRVYGFVVPLYVFFGSLGYFAFGSAAKANINLNYPNNWANYASILAQLFQEFYFVASSSLVLMLQVELAMGVSPTSWWWNVTGEEISALEIDVESSYDRCRSAVNDLSGDASSRPPPPNVEHQKSQNVGNLEIDSESAEVQARNIDFGLTLHQRLRPLAFSLRTLRLPPVAFRMLFRTSFLAGQVLVAWFMLGGDGDVLLAVQALAGAVGFLALTYFLPLVFGWILLPRTGALKCSFYAASLLVCGVLMVLGIWHDLIDLVSSAGAFSSGTACRLELDAYASDGCIAALGARE